MKPIQWSVACVAGVLAACVMPLTGGCESSGEALGSGAAMVRNSAEAQRLTDLAMEEVDRDPAAAERLLRRAIDADAFHGPAHNNLGVLLLRGPEPRLYEAAQRFEWARKLMPGNPDPRANLALTLERAGQSDEALACYRSALDVAPEHVPALQGLAAIQIRAGRPDAATRRALGIIAVQGTTEHWRHWARLQAAKIGG